METEPKAMKMQEAQAEPITLVVNSDSEVPSAAFENLVLIAEGATGVVYSARRVSDRHPVAIKIYKKELIPDSEASQRFKKEVETLGKVGHPNIVKILDSGTTSSGESYIAMELVDGVSISTLLETEGVFEPRRGVTVTREICRALTSLHLQGIIHRDLKPNNIILDQNNVVKIVDFGVAKVLNASNETITQYGAIIGTPAYMSPEQCLGQKVDERSDIYSLGCTLFEMLTGTKAFESTTAMEALAKQINSDRTFIDKMLTAAGTPQDLKTIIRKCLYREANKRYDTIAKLDHDLGAFLLGAPLTFSNTQVVDKVSQTDSETSNKWWQVGLCSAAVLTAALIIKSNMDVIRKSLGSPSTPPISRRTPDYADKGKPIGCTIKSRRDEKVIFSDPSAHNLQEALRSAADRGVSLRYADLRNADLTQIKLNSLDLSYSDLTNAQFLQAKLNDVDFHGANLQNSTFLQASMLGVNFSNCKLSGANLSQCKAPGGNFAGADLHDASLDQAHFEGANFKYANLSDIHSFSTSFRRANLSFADFAGVDMRSIGRSGLQDANVYNAKNLNLVGI